MMDSSSIAHSEESHATDWDVMLREVLADQRGLNGALEVVGADDFTTISYDYPDTHLVPPLVLWVRTAAGYARGRVRIPHPPHHQVKSLKIALGENNQADVTLWLTALSATAGWARSVRGMRFAVGQMRMAGLSLADIYLHLGVVSGDVARRRAYRAVAGEFLQSGPQPVRDLAQCLASDTDRLAAGLAIRSRAS